MISQEILNRKGARKTAEVPAGVLDLLNQGRIETVNLTEWLVIDQLKLLKSFLAESTPEVSQGMYNQISEEVESLKRKTVNTVNETIGKNLYTYLNSSKDTELFQNISGHVSDTVRGWGAYVVANTKELSIAEMMEQIKPFAADSHFGVREIAWLSMRPVMVKTLKETIALMAQWAKSADENIRRFASESLRPRGVWCKHIDSLKENPDQAINILEPLKSDSSKYVRDSVGNWINDASKTAPDWVEETCARWMTDSDTKETHYIIKKGLRTLRKK